MAISKPGHACGGGDKSIGCYRCYEVGYRNGESSVSADNSFWFHDILGLPDEWSNWKCKNLIELVIDRHRDEVDDEVEL